MARIYARGKTLWIYYHFNNKACRESLKLTDTKKNRLIAQEILFAKQMELKRKNHFVVSGRMVFSDAAQEFLIHKQSETEHTAIYEQVLKQFYNCLQNDVPVTSINEKDILNFKNTLSGKSDHTIQTYIYHLKIFFNYLVKEKRISDNPVKIKIKPFKTDINVYVDNDYRKLKLYLYIHNKDQYRLIHFLYLTGFRRSEALSIKWEDIDWRNKIIKVRNTKAKRIDHFPLYSELFEFLQKFKKEKGKIFNYTKDGLKFYRRALDRLTLPSYSIHDLRRTFGTRMAQKALSPYELTKIMRHNSIRTSMKYYINIDISNIGDKM